MKKWGGKKQSSVSLYPVFRGGAEPLCDRSRQICLFIDLLCDGIEASLRYSTNLVRGIPSRPPSAHRSSSRGRAHASFASPATSTPVVPALLALSSSRKRGFLESPVYHMQSTTPSDASNSFPLLSPTPTARHDFDIEGEIERNPYLQPHHMVVFAMASEGFTSQTLKSLPIGISAILRECISMTRLDPPAHWSSQVYAFIERHDLSHLHASERHASHGPIVDYCEVDMFPQDRRFFEVIRLLSPNLVPAMASNTEQSTSAGTQRTIWRLIQRTFSSSVGRGMARFGCSASGSMMTDLFDFAPLKAAARSLQTGAVLHFDREVLRTVIDIPADYFAWPEFHHACSEALETMQTNRSSHSVSRSWITYHTMPASGAVEDPKARAQRAGLLLGFGIQGHLRNLSRHDIYRFLSERDECVSVGLLLGLSLSWKESMDLSTTRVLAMHVPALLPAASDVQVPFPVQAAALVGVGFLYMKSCHRFMKLVWAGNRQKHKQREGKQQNNTATRE
jgi:hypothetical protein